ncbi:MAG: hypothetical protein QM802_17010 [Agriterribacter sp.]
MGKSLILLFCIFIFCCCKRKGSVSMFLFIPKAEKDLLRNNYSYNDTKYQYSKHVGDTVENVSVKGKGIFSKYFYIKRHAENFKVDSIDSLTKMSNFITNGADSVIFDFGNISKILEIKGSVFFITFGYSSKMTFYLIAYHNLDSKIERDDSVTSLEHMKVNYSNLFNRNKIDSAINFIKEMRSPPAPHR